MEEGQGTSEQGGQGQGARGLRQGSGRSQAWLTEEDGWRIRQWGSTGTFSVLDIGCKRVCTFSFPQSTATHRMFAAPPNPYKKNFTSTTNK